MTVFETAQKYYPRLWSIDRLNALLEAGKLSKEEYDTILAESEKLTDD